MERREKWSGNLPAQTYTLGKPYFILPFLLKVCTWTSVGLPGDWDIKGHILPWIKGVIKSSIPGTWQFYD